MRKNLLSIILIMSIIFLIIPAVKAENEAVFKRYIVILEEPALYSDERPMFFSGNEEYNNEVRKALLELQADIKSRIRSEASLYANTDSFENEFSYTDVLNGFTITADAKTAEAVSKIDGVKEVFADEVIAVIENDPAETVEKAELYSETVQTLSAANSGNMINTPYAYEKGYTGEGRTIAILDSTLYYYNNYFTLTDESKAKYTKETLAETFADKGMSFIADSAYKSAKVPFAYDYAENSYNISAGKSEHGTHVSGIAAGYKTTVGDGIIRGVAPDAQILFFGVESRGGGIYFSVAAKAIDDAVKLGADSINMSFGDDYSSENQTGKSYTSYRTAIINAENAGCSIANSAGNMGRGNCVETKDIDYSSASNVFFPNGTKVGSVHNNYRVARKLTDENGNDYASEVQSSSYVLALTEILNCGTGTANEISSLSLAGKVAVISKPDDIFAATNAIYFNRAASAGASAVIIIDNDEQIPDTYFSSLYSIPFFLMTKSEGERLLLNATQIKSEKRLMIAKNSDSPMASASSAYGYSDTLDISVDFSAPGGNIYSAYNYSFMPLSGTSMASPHIAGAHVLMNQYVEDNFPGYTGKAKVTLIKNLLASTAQTVYGDNDAITSVRQMGSGVIQLDNAMQTKVILHDGNSVSRVTLGDNIGKEFTVKFFAENISDTEITFDSVSVELSTDDYKYYDTLNKYAFCGIKKLNATISGDTSVTVTPHSIKEVTVTVALSDEDIEYLNTAMTNGFFVDGKVTLSAFDNSNPSVGIPFTGFYGEWAKITPVDESSINDSITVYSGIGDAKLYGVLESVAQGYTMPFTRNPDISISESPLSLSMKIRRNIFLKITLDGEQIYNGFIKKNINADIKELIATNSTLSEKVNENGSAVIEIFCTLPLNQSVGPDQKIDITIVPQDTKPHISSIGVTEGNGTRILKLTASGNLVSTIVRKGHDTSGEERIAYMTVRKAEATISDNVSELKDASYYVYDSAFNMSAIEHDISIEVTEDNKAVFKNTTVNKISGLCILAVYTDSGKLEDVIYLCKKDTAFLPYKNLEVDVSAYADKNYKIFFWKSTETLVPHCGAFE